MKATTTVTLRTQKLKDGRESFFIETYYNGERKRRSLGIYLLEGRSKEIKAKNIESKYLAEQILQKEVEKAKNADLGIDNNSRGLDINLWQFIRLREQEKEKEGNHDYALNLQQLRKHLENYEPRRNFTLRMITSEWLQGFATYLKQGKRLKREDAKKEPDGKISQNGQSAILKKMVTLVNYLFKQKLIPTNPAINLERIKNVEHEKVFLTTDEMRILKQSVNINPKVKRAFLFSCFTGLRYSDIVALRWRNIMMQDGRHIISYTQEKTDEHVYAYLNEQAVEQLGIRPDDPDEHVFANLPNNGSCNRILRQWAKDDKINKRVHYHSSRHTFAITLLNSGVDVYTVSKLMGHKSLQNTIIYAKILNTTKQKAIDSFPKI